MMPARWLNFAQQVRRFKPFGGGVAAVGKGLEAAPVRGGAAAAATALKR